MNRFDRITAIHIQLQSKKVVRAQDLADRFQVSLRTIYRDIRSLEESGVPLYGEAGTGYSLVDGYRLPPVMFTPDEAMAFITAGKLMEKFSDSALKESFTSALFKIKAVLRGSEKDLVENLENQIAVHNYKPQKNQQNNALDVLLKSIAEKKVVKMVYKAFGKEKENERLAEPIGIFHENEQWYTIAFCHLRNEYRQFRIDRIISVVLTDTSQKDNISLSQYKALDKKNKEQQLLQKVVIRVEKRVLIYIQERRHFYGFIAEKDLGDNTVELTFLTAWPQEGLLRWFMMFADMGEIIEPEWLRNKATELVEQIVQKNNFPINLLT